MGMRFRDFVELRLGFAMDAGWVDRKTDVFPRSALKWGYYGNRVVTAPTGLVLTRKEHWRVWQAEIRWGLIPE